jgi:kinesin family protein C2/C3
MTDQRLGTVKEWEFDRVLGSASTQEDVFDCIKPLLQSALDGYNVCIFAYGQTGSGKTYTMEGPSGQPGVNYRTAKELFRLIETRKPAWNYQISGSMLEIYNVKVKDLL